MVVACGGCLVVGGSAAKVANDAAAERSKKSTEKAEKILSGYGVTSIADGCTETMSFEAGIDKMIHGRGIRNARTIDFRIALKETKFGDTIQRKVIWVEIDGVKQ